SWAGGRLAPVPRPCARRWMRCSATFALVAISRRPPRPHPPEAPVRGVLVIIARSPLRISLGGGGTDLPSYYRQHGGFLLAAAIDKAVYVCVHRTFVPDMVVRYSRIERVPRAAEIKHPIVREALALLEIAEPNIEITSMADIPAGTGLGSSGSF